MEAIVITWRELFIGVVVLVLAVYIAEQLSIVLTGISLLRKPRPFTVITKKRTEAGLRKEIEKLQQRLAVLEERLAQQDALDASAPPNPYLRAIQMAKQGHDAESLSAGCGISRSEAELIVAMHGNQTT